MTKVSAPADCGNAPKKLFLRDFNVACAQGQVEQILEYVTDDVRWDMAGRQTVVGKDALAAALGSGQNGPAMELIIEKIITHGVDAAANGTVTYGDGEKYAFCNVYRFSGHGKNARIKCVTSYVIGLH